MTHQKSIVDRINGLATSRTVCARTTRTTKDRVAINAIESAKSGATPRRSTRASTDAMTVRHKVVSGMRHRDADATPVLRRRSVAGAMRDLVTRGPVGQRNRP